MINRVKFQLMHYDYTSYPPDYTFRLPKLHLCIWGVNRSGYVSNTILGERERERERKKNCCWKRKIIRKFVIRELCKADKAREAKFVSCISSLQSISFSSAAECLAQTLRKKAIFIFVTFWNFGHKISLKFKQLSTFSDCAMPLDHLVFLERKIFLVLSLTTQADAWVTVWLFARTELQIQKSLFL